jgi:hypothetical protein
MRYISILFLLLMTSCATPQEYAAEAIAAFGPYCEALGYQRDTDPWRHCIQIEDLKASQRMSDIMNPPVRRCYSRRRC